MRTRTAALASAGFFLVGPGIVVGLVPWWLTGWRLREPVPYWAPVRVLGALLIVGGLAVTIQAFARFVVEGLGTPVPVAAPRRLVTGGAYRYVRNPMYVALLAVIAGEALLLRQLGLLLYALLVWILPAAFVHWYEEPALASRFGAEYEAYRRAVPAWLPRLTAWRPDDVTRPRG